MDLRQLRYFIAVAEERHFGRGRPGCTWPNRRCRSRSAAWSATSVSSCCTAPPAGRSQPAGAAYLEQARRILIEVEEARHEARRVAAGSVGRLSVGCVGSATYPRSTAVCFRDGC